MHLIEHQQRAPRRRQYLDVCIFKRRYQGDDPLVRLRSAVLSQLASRPPIDDDVVATRQLGQVFPFRRSALRGTTASYRSRGSPAVGVRLRERQKSSVRAFAHVYTV